MLLFQSPIASPAARKAEHVGGDLHSLSQLDAKVFLDTFDAFTRVRLHSQAGVQNQSTFYRNWVCRVSEKALTV